MKNTNFLSRVQSELTQNTPPPENQKLLTFFPEFKSELNPPARSGWSMWRLYPLRIPSSYLFSCRTKNARNNIVQFRHSKKTSWRCFTCWLVDLKQECIPVGCVPPACWPYPIVSHGGFASGGGGSASMGWADPPVMWPVMHAERPTPQCGQTPVKTLPCPKLRLRVVMTSLINT